MNLECLNGIITDNLAIHIDLTQLKSWDLNSGFTSVSLTKWTGAVSDNIDLIDFGLTEFDDGRTNVMWSGITLQPQDILFSMYRVGYNRVKNPTTGQTSGVTVTTLFDQYPISGVTTGTSGNYFELHGGYLQGFFQLKDYNFKLFPSRYNNGITIETLVYLHPNSQGIFYMMGARAEDKYNPYFSGETITGLTGTTGVTTSFENYLDAIEEKEELKKGFKSFEDRYKKVGVQSPALQNIENNVIAFELTQDKKIAYKYVNADGLIITNASQSRVTETGFTMIDIAFSPYETIDNPAVFDCAPQRLGKMIIYVNGRAIWIIKDFPEFYFKAFANDKEKQIGVPYSISWGGGSFGLKHSWHYDYQTYSLYTGQNTAYINNIFFVQGNPIPTECVPAHNTHLAGLSLSADSTTFKFIDSCSVEYPLTVMRIKYTGGTGTTYFIKFNQPISVLSNRNYEVNLSLFNDGFFNSIDMSGNTVHNKVSILVYGTTNIDIVDEIQYVSPLTQEDLANLKVLGLHPIPDKQEYEYRLDGVMYYGVTGFPVIDDYGYLYGVDLHIENIPLFGNMLSGALITGDKAWKPLKTVFRSKENSGQQHVFMGVLIETTDVFNTGGTLYLNNFKYTAADILVQDDRKANLTIEQNFDSSFIGGIQKLRIYNNALTSPEILHNALEEAKNSALNMKVSKGGRIIYR